MRCEIKPNGNLLILAGNRDRSDLTDAYRRHGYHGAESLVAEWLHESYEFIRPEQVGALTSAPILADCDGLDYSDEAAEIANHDSIYDFPAIMPEAKVFWFPNYAVQCPWETLRDRGRVEFTAAKD